MVVMNLIQPVTPVTFLMAGLFGLCSAYLAHRGGRNPYKWFFIGALFGIFGLAILFVIPRMKKEASQSKTIPLPEINGPADKLWYYLDPSQEQQGPMSHHALTSALRQGKISLSTYVWHEDLGDWKVLKEFVKEGNEMPSVQ